MASVDIEVANLPATESAPAPEAPKPAEQPKRDFFKDDVYEPTYDHSDDKVPARKEEVVVEAPEAKTPADPEVKPETPAVAAAAPKHSPEAMQAAQSWGIPADEIDQMSAAELTRTIKHMNASAQAAFDYAKKQAAPAPAPAEVKAEDVIFSPEEEASIDPTAAKILKDKFKGFKSELSKRDAEIAEMKQELVANRLERVHGRLDGLVKGEGDGAAKVLDRTTAAGAKAFNELMVTMKFVQEKGRALGQDYSEKEILQRSLREMGIAGGKTGAAQDAAIEEALAKRKAEHDEGALSKPNSRESDESVEAAVRRVLQKRKLPVASAQEPTTWEPD